MKKKIRVFVIEDNRILREGIGTLIKAQKDMSLSGLSSGSDNWLGTVIRKRPELILVDLGLRKSSLKIVESLKKAVKNAKVVVMGLATSQSDVVEYVQAGASGFVLKDASVAEFLATLRSVVRGRDVLPPILTESLFSQVISRTLKKGISTASLRITRREQEVVALVAEGLSNKEIARKLNIAVDTVKNHVHNILEKLALRSRLQIARLHNHWIR